MKPRRGYQSPRNTVFYLLERGGVFTLDQIAHSCHIHHGTAEVAALALIRMGKIKTHEIGGKQFFEIEEKYRVAWTLATWDLLAERLLDRLSVNNSSSWVWSKVWTKWGTSNQDAPDPSRS